MSKVYSHLATRYVCRYCGNDAGHNPELCPRCGPVCGECGLAVNCPQDPDRAQSFLRLALSLLRYAVSSGLLWPDIWLAQYLVALGVDLPPWVHAVANGNPDRLESLTEVVRGLMLVDSIPSYQGGRL